MLKAKSHFLSFKWNSQILRDFKKEPFVTETEWCDMYFCSEGF